MNILMKFNIIPSITNSKNINQAKNLFYLIRNNQFNKNDDNYISFPLFLIYIYPAENVF